jgi:hypothetical protein
VVVPEPRTRGRSARATSPLAPQLVGQGSRHSCSVPRATLGYEPGSTGSRLVLVVRSLSKPERSRLNSWNLDLARPRQASADLQAFRGHRIDGGTACHAEGRGFDSLQPLPEHLRFAGLFGRP